MKHSKTLLVAFFGTLSIASAATSEVPANASVSMGQGPPGVAARMTLSDPGNHVWVVERSTNMTDWSPVTVTKVHNGHFIYDWLPEEGTPGAYYRAGYDADQQDIGSTWESALNLAATPANYSAIPLPQHLLALNGQNNTPVTNPTTNPGAELGRVLFYDKRLSLNQTISCSSCHQAAHGFSDSARFSTGFEGGLTGRNSMGLTSARYYPRGHFFWDERAATLEDQVLQPIQNSVEMGMTLPALETRLAAEPFYAPLFQAAFGDSAVTSDRISKALAQFVRSIVSYQTKYDQGVPVNFNNFTNQERQGRQIFNGAGTCNTCHGSDNFVPNNVFNNGLENPYVDKGIGGISGRPQDEGVFKVPSLRNIAMTAPYMHDGRFATLEEVVEFYNSGIVAHPNLSPPLRLPPGPGVPPNAVVARRLNLSTNDKAALVAFLQTLNDTSVTTDPKFQDPFEYGE